MQSFKESEVHRAPELGCTVDLQQLHLNVCDEELMFGFFFLQSLGSICILCQTVKSMFQRKQEKPFKGDFLRGY